jgi:hypothetical protein
LLQCFKAKKKKRHEKQIASFTGKTNVKKAVRR